MLTTKKETFNCDQQAKFIQDRIILAEKNFGQVYQIFVEYLRKIARIRDKNDEFAKIFLTFSENEEVNKTLSHALGNVALSFSILGDLGELRVSKIETNVLPEITQYEGICKQAKEEVKHIFTVRDREIVKKRQLDRIRERNPRNRQQITQAETELLRATADVSRTIHNLEEQTNEFEKRKLHDTKQILLNFVTIEMAYHAKALEVLTKAYQEIDLIDEESDLQEFRKTLKSPDGIQNYKSKVSKFKSAQSQSLNTLLSSPNKQAFVSNRLSSSANKLKINQNTDTIDVDNTGSGNSATESDSDTRSNSETSNKFLARKQKHR